MSRKITAAQKHQLMTKMLASQAGRKRIAASIQEPLRKLRDYQAIGRKAMLIDELPDGALPIYDRDVDTPAYVVGEEGESVQKVVKATRLLVPIFELASNPTVPFTQVKERRFDIVARIKKKSKDELFRKEDNIIFSALEAAGANNTVNSQVSVAAASFGMDDMATAFSQVETHGHRVDKVFMNAQEYRYFRNAGRDYIDFETQRELLRTGYLGLLWGAQIFMSPEITAGKIILTAEPEYIGVVPVRIDLTVIPADQPTLRQFGWSVFEAIGVGIHNEYGLQTIVVT